jgi:crotonobetainyl-CoA:carnitine CoA-transferase CaiB-like acyl-CoA transferase
MGALTALLARDVSGQGQQVDVSAQASLMAAIAHAPIFWDLLGENAMRSGPCISGRSVSGAAFRNIWPCKDGYVAIALYGGPIGRHTFKAMTVWMDERGGAPEVMKRTDWDNFDVATVSREAVAELEGAIGPFLQGLTRQEFFKGVIERNMLGYMAATVEDIWRDEQLAARGFWQEIDAPWGGTTPFPGSFALFDGLRPAIRCPAPTIGQHNAEIYGHELGLSADDLMALRAAGAI